MAQMLRASLIVLLTLAAVWVQAQKVGVVLSGGGATGLAHVGVLKALEENGIPVDYIAGSSIGALVGGMYAAGISPEAMDSLFHTRLYQTMAAGGLEAKDVYYFKQEPPDASLLQLKFDPDTSIQTALPTNFRSPALIDLELMRLFAPASAHANENMDSLFVPFRCVASNITDRHPVVFETGSLAQAIRASMSYPFYFKPIMIDGKMMMDGGLYNNFPSDIMYDHFFPDIIIGSNVAFNSPPPDQDDLLSQLRAMFQERTDYSVICENGIIIEPQTDQGLFEFTDPGTVIQDGYDAAMEKMPEVLAAIQRRELQGATQMRRSRFIAGQPEMRIGNIEINGLTDAQARFSKRILNKHGEVLTAAELKPRYFRLFADRNIALMYPTAHYDRSTGNFDLDLTMKAEKELQVRLGGVFSSRPVTAGMASLQYNLFGKSSSLMAANTYFGKFYSSVQLRTRTDLSTPALYIEPLFTLNRWDHFKNFTSFFNEERPSFIVMRELWAGVNVGTGLGNKGLIKYDAKYAQFKDNYYQTPDFTNQDTADVTEFFHATFGVSGERNSLNRKQHPSRGEQLKAGIRYYNGEERTRLGSTAIIRGLQTDFHDWFEARVRLEKYLLTRGAVNFGMQAEGVYSTLPFFNNYQATIIRAPSYAPTPEMKGYFLEDFRAQQFVAGGIIGMVTFAKKIDLRMEGHIFQPYRAIFSNDEGGATEGEAVSDRSYLASGSLIYNSPVGPIWMNTSYIQGLREPWVFSLSFGYMIFNQRVGE